MNHGVSNRVISEINKSKLIHVGAAAAAIELKGQIHQLQIPFSIRGLDFLKP